jgi:hypothetical protein
MRTSTTVLMLFILFIIGSAILSATPSTIIWIPSTDIQGSASWHGGIKNNALVLLTTQPDIDR